MASASDIASEPDWSRYRAVGDILREQAALRPDKPFLISIDEDGRSMSFGALWRFSNRFARLLHARGVGAGGRVAVLTGNRLEMLALYFAIQQTGFVSAAGRRPETPAKAGCSNCSTATAMTTTRRLPGRARTTSAS